MAIKQPSKSSSSDLPSLGNPGITLGVDLKKAALFTVDIKGTINRDNPNAIFKLNPSTWSENKTANWVATNIPGQSDPVYQWVSSGARTLTFEALVTADTSDYNIEEAKRLAEIATPESQIEAVATYALKLFKVQIPPKRNTGTVVKNTDVLDISRTLNYYRSLLYPTYSNSTSGVPGNLKSSPSLLVLLAGSGIAKQAYEQRITNQHDVWVLTDLRINITKQLSNLTPIEATVGFTLVQYNIRSFDRSRFTT